MTQLGLFANTPATGESRRVLLAGGPLDYAFQRGNRRTISIQIGKYGVQVKAPRWLALREVESFIREKEEWIRRRFTEHATQSSTFKWQSGAQIPYLGEALVLSIAENASRENFRVRRDELSLYLESGSFPKAFGAPRSGSGIHENDVRAAVLHWLRSEAMAIFTPRVKRFIDLLNVAVPAIRLSNARGRWGSCSRKSGIRLSWRLIHFQPHLIDYVVAHECAHLVEMNHSPRFWSVVERIYPQWRSARRELRSAERQLPNL